MEDKKHIQDALSQASQTSSSQAAPSPRTLTENMASSPDRLQDFDLKKQDLWLEHSNAIIEELSHSLPDYPQQKPVLRKDIRCPEEVLLTQAGCAYAFLASKRRDIAKLLKQGPLRYQFGLFNKPGFVSTDDFNLVKHLPNQKETIYQQLTALISETPADVDIHRQMDEATNGIIYTIKIKMASDKLKRQHEENLKSPIPFIDDDDTDLTITFQDYGLDNPKTAIQIDHHPTPFAKNYSNDSSYFYVQFILIEPYVRACLAWSSDKGIHEFLKNAGRMAHALAHLQPVGRGNSAIVEWMIRALAKINHIELGPFNQDEKIGWDFKAFLTPDVEQYAAWFAAKAFKQCEIKDQSEASTRLKK